MGIYNPTVKCNLVHGLKSWTLEERVTVLNSYQITTFYCLQLPILIIVVVVVVVVVLLVVVFSFRE
jgi:hypothetical protein